MPKICNVDDCSNNVFGKGYCKYHQHLRTDKKTVQKKPLKPIKNISVKMQLELKVYRMERDKYMKDHSKCEFRDCFRYATDLHHKSGRGQNLSNVETFMALCRKCHTWIHENPKEARLLGYLK